MINHREDSIIALREAREKEAAIQSAVLHLFTRLAEGGEVDNATIAAHSPLFEVWSEGDILAPGAIRRCPESSLLYRYNVEPPAPASIDGDNLEAAALSEVTQTQYQQQGITGKKKLKPPSKNPDYWTPVLP